jgi:hypothetical protein
MMQSLGSWPAVQNTSRKDGYTWRAKTVRHKKAPLRERLDPIQASSLPTPFVNLPLDLVQGIETRASLDMSGMGNGLQMDNPMGGKMTPPQIRQGRVIVAVTDAAQGDIFTNAYAQMGAPIECVAAMGQENVWNICQQAYALLLQCLDLHSGSWNHARIKFGCIPMPCM